LTAAFLTLQPNWWVIINEEIVGNGKYSSTDGRAIVDCTPKGVPSKQTSLSCPEIPAWLDGWALLHGCFAGLSFMAITIRQFLQ
jgi:hypothetical protein